MDNIDPIPLSALQHWAYCPRQGALIHLEQAFDIHTLRGNAVVVAFQERKQEEIQHPLRAQPVPLGMVPLSEERPAQLLST